MFLMGVEGIPRGNQVSGLHCFPRGRASSSPQGSSFYNDQVLPSLDIPLPPTLPPKQLLRSPGQRGEGTGRGKGKHVVPADTHGTSRWPLLPFKDTFCVCGPRQREHCWLLFVRDYLRSLSLFDELFWIDKIALFPLSLILPPRAD